ncbi:putative O-methyltransferase [Aspergillus saccharolyticus JOP 1030-1]|uniref:Putative O-methyltransferase n=1 Tax=Aspergillus saccharolyticus JOP 1030-1 TaxID=1450539 RepID=A0A318Z656_9EURO|nr:putative O-methyltransferase [Aspergillus saccharolyticus JOP 1030-1]PYH42549.1 putative O-methyltransferase [Aspergillus saccharolyticus JOP 1030-1]
MSNTLTEVTSAVTTALSKLPSPESIDNAARMQLLGALDKLRAALEPPPVTLLNHCFSFWALSVIRVAQGMGIFDAFAVAEGTKQLTLDELNSRTKGDKELLFRVMRYLCAQKIFTRPSQESYQPGPLASQLSSGLPTANLIKHFYLHMRTAAHLYEYFEAKDYRNPADACDAPFQFAQCTRQHHFDWLTEHPDDQEAFNSTMSMTRTADGIEWFNFYPVEEKLQVASPDRTLLIDIGGGIGHDISAFKQRFPQLPGQLVLQDLPQVINDIPSPLAGIAAQSHSMFDAQPVRNAKAYYLRTVLHDWPDKQALEVLTRIREAMAEDSVLLINEHTPAAGGELSPIAAALDLHMMQTFSALERTEEQWVALLEKGGFRVVKVWKPQQEGLHLTTTAALYEAVPQ